MLTKLSELHSLNLMREASKESRLIADFASWWDRNALRWPHKLALFDSRHRLTWEGAARAARCLSSALLALGLRPGEVVASWLPNWVESYILHTACEHAGLAWLPIPVSLREYEVKPILERVEARALFVAGRWHRMNYVEAIQQMHPRLPCLRYLVGVRTEEKGDLLSWEKLLSEEGRDFPRPKKPGPLILPTSGSTGVPKFAYFSASSWLLRGRLQAELFRLQPEDLFLAMAEGIGPSIPPLFAASVAGSGV
ncbi:long-chain fatty acid--CoA ligase, partial [bacterium]